MISAAIETCWRSIPTSCDKPRVIATVIGMQTATSSALRHSMNTSDTSTTMTIASIRFG